ncbi:cupin domain-containing protein [Tropicimonas sp. IMCC34011]|uniref:cupin domain-containing protein n=1 Tax=Tropicimonas sp. IMCC34011 TaxID=2248759 RepID=UPI000E237B5A|nr:cupin domain-containing protein [Tropicimonas sp. IMCC34011]
MQTAEEIIAGLSLEPHPEGGHYRQSWVSWGAAGERPSGTAIYYLLAAGEVSRWHRVDADEVWHFYAGDPLVLALSRTDEGPATPMTLGSDFAAGQRPQIIVPNGWWQAARSSGAWTLVGCTVSPGFRFEGFEMAPEGFDIPLG